MKAPSATTKISISADRPSYSFFYLERALAAEGLGLDDIESVDMPDSLLIEAFRNKRVDVGAVSEPWITRIVRSGVARVWTPALQVIPDFHHAFVFFGPTLLDQHREAGQRFMAAYLKGVQQYAQGKTPRNLDILVARTGLDRELLESSCWPTFSKDGRVHIQSILEYQAWAVKHRLVDVPVPPDQLWDPRFLGGTVRTR